MENNNPYAPPAAPVRDFGSDAPTQLASRGSRLGAAFLDGLIFVLLIYLPLLLVMGAGNLAAAAGDITSMLTGSALAAAAPGALILIVVTFILVKRNGQTIGKKLLSIKVVRSSGEPASVARIFWVRNVVITLLSFIPIIGTLLGLIDTLLIFRESRQCLHDQIADTIVIKA